MSQSTAYIYGIHAVNEALTHAPKSVLRVLLAPGKDELRDKARKAHIDVQKLDPRQLPREVDKEANHQGALALVSLSGLVKPYREFIDSLEVTADTALVVLAEVQDPHNVGAVIRSAAAFGASGVLIPEHRQAPVTGTVVKVSAGTAFTLPLVSIPNVNTALRDLKERKFWTYGLSMGGDHPIADETFDAPAVFVLGGEAEGLREKTMEECDFLLTIPMHPRAESLNAAASAAVVLYAWNTQHPSSRG
jgi:23S rRNA (guanosine2251-2'-O)-methyltransferase